MQPYGDVFGGSVGNGQKSHAESWIRGHSAWKVALVLHTCALSTLLAIGLWGLQELRLRALPHLLFLTVAPDQVGDIIHL